MNRFSRAELKTLTKIRRNGCVSMYLPTHKAGREVKQDRIRFKNLLTEAEKQLIANNIRTTEARKIIEPAQQLLSDSIFWRHLSDSLAVFLAPKASYSYRLPLELTELVVVTNRFHVKPLLSMLTNDGQFYVLALGKQIKLYQGTRFSINEIKLEDIPVELGAALKGVQSEKHLQFHTRTAEGSGKRAAIFHGQGAGIDDTKKRLLHYFRQVDKGLRDVLGNEQVPLVTAGIKDLLTTFREVSTYPHPVEKFIAGNPDRLNMDELHSKAWAIVRPHFQKAEHAAVEQYRQLAGTGKTSKDLREIVPAACNRRIAILFVAVGVQQWGTFDAKSNTMQLHRQAKPGDEDLLDYAAIQSLVNGGTVYAVKSSQVPDGAPSAAVFRF